MNNKELTKKTQEIKEILNNHIEFGGEETPNYHRIVGYNELVATLADYITKTTQSNDEIKREVGSIYGIPIKTFDPDNLLDEMKKAKDGTVFVIGENVIKHHEGGDTVEVVMCQVFRGKDETLTQKETQ